MRDYGGCGRLFAGGRRRRSLRRGAASHGLRSRGSRQHPDLIAGRPPAGIPQSWQRLAGAESALSTEYSFHPGVYQAGERLLAVNRAAAEDQAAVLEDSRVAELFHGLDFTRVDDRAGSAKALVQEIWRLFLEAMIVAMVCEAALCLPKPRRVVGSALRGAAEPAERHRGLSLQHDSKEGAAS